VAPWEEMKWKEDREMSHYEPKTIRTAILRMSITKINFLLHYLKSLVEGLISAEKTLYSAELICSLLQIIHKYL
jgi:hypothetical protein